MTARILTPADYQCMPWKNGHGKTHEIAALRSTDDLQTETGRFQWRLSIAEVAASVPFSTFPGCDRIILLLEGDGMVLDSGADGCHELYRKFEPYAFRGEWQTDCRLRGGPCRDFNVMVDRARARAQVTLVPVTAAPHELKTVGHSWALFSLAGTLTAVLDSPPAVYALATHHTLLVDADPNAPAPLRLTLHTSDGEATALLVAFTRLVGGT
jgi:environmental stress-induced protein Ves